MLIKNQIYEAAIVDYTSEGQGIAKIDGCAVFIPNAIFGEKCRVRIEVAKKSWAAGKIVDVLDYPGNSVYVVKGKYEYMIPAVSEFLEDVNVDGGYIKVKLLEGMAVG